MCTNTGACPVLDLLDFRAACLTPQPLRHFLDAKIPSAHVLRRGDPIICVLDLHTVGEKLSVVLLCVKEPLVQVGSPGGGPRSVRAGCQPCSASVWLTVRS